MKGRVLFGMHAAYGFGSRELEGRVLPYGQRAWPFQDSAKRRVGDDACICVGAKVIGGAGWLRVGRGTVVGANAVLLESTGDWEIWAGVPARKVGKREVPAR